MRRSSDASLLIRVSLKSSSIVLNHQIMAEIIAHCKIGEYGYSDGLRFPCILPYYLNFPKTLRIFLYTSSKFFVFRFGSCWISDTQGTARLSKQSHHLSVVLSNLTLFLKTTFLKQVSQNFKN